MTEGLGQDQTGSGHSGGPLDVMGAHLKVFGSNLNIAFPV